MSKVTPEIGDVFEYKGKKIHILYIIKDILCTCLVTNEYDYWSANIPIYGDMNYLGKSKANIDDLFKTENEEEWTPLSKLGHLGIDFDLISSNEFLECVKVQGFVDDDGDGYPVIKADDGTLLYDKKKSVYPSEIQNKDKLDFDYVAWFNK